MKDCSLSWITGPTLPVSNGDKEKAVKQIIGTPEDQKKNIKTHLMGTTIPNKK